jgi:predicted DNA-binding transcriptional regulator AlpA
MVSENTLGTLLNEHDVSRITCLSVASVRRWRLLRQGPKYIKIGAAVRYKLEDVSAWLETRPTGGGNQAEPGMKQTESSTAANDSCRRGRRPTC